MEALLALEATLRASAGFLHVAGPPAVSVRRLRFGLWPASRMVQSAPVAVELQALTAGEGAAMFEIKRAASIFVVSSCRAESSSGTPSAESSKVPHLSRAPSDAFELAVSESWKVSGRAEEPAWSVAIFLG